MRNVLDCWDQIFAQMLDSLKSSQTEIALWSKQDFHQRRHARFCFFDSSTG